MTRHKSEVRKLNSIISFRCDQAEKNIIESNANLVNLSTSMYVKSLALNKKIKTKKITIDPLLITTLSQLGVNLKIASLNLDKKNSDDINLIINEIKSLVLNIVDIVR